MSDLASAAVSIRGDEAEVSCEVLRTCAGPVILSPDSFSRASLPRDQEVIPGSPRAAQEGPGRMRMLVIGPFGLFYLCFFA